MGKSGNATTAREDVSFRARKSGEMDPQTSDLALESLLGESEKSVTFRVPNWPLSVSIAEKRWEIGVQS